jgi:hypothetical protein
MAEIDFMEYSSDANAAAAYVSNGTEIVSQQQTTVAETASALGDSGGNEYRRAQSFKLDVDSQITAVEIKQGDASSGSPSGNWTLRIETNNAGVPSGTLANVNASIVVTPPGANTIIKGTFATPFQLLKNTSYWIVIDCDNQADNNMWFLSYGGETYADGTFATKTNGVWAAGSGADYYFKVYVKSLQSFSESTLKTQGSYALKAVAAKTDSLNKTLTKTF